MNAPAEVSSVPIDANTRKLVASNGCKITNVAGTPQKIEFTRLDEGLPLNAQTFFALHFRFVPIHTELNQHLVQINSLSPGNYDIVVDGNKIANYSADDLAKGVNVSSSTIDPWQPGGPWDAQANILHALTESRDRLESSISAPMIAVTEKAEFPKQFRSEVLKANSQLEEIQRLAAKPHPYHFVVQRSDSAAGPKFGTN